MQGENGADSGKDERQIAVAVRYDAEDMKAPQVVASGKGLLAEQILQIAFAAGIKVRRDADLAQILSAVDVDSEIPVEAFAAVAEILAYIYWLNGSVPDGVSKEEAAIRAEFLRRLSGEDDEEQDGDTAKEADADDATTEDGHDDDEP